ncbi:hypothetical protein pb186bvf_014429 [Paramecium bursaria]
MSRILNFLSSFDLFSVQFTPSIFKADKFEYKTIIGALMSIGIMAISLLYAIYISYQWLSFQFLAVITQEISTLDSNRIIELDHIQFTFQSVSGVLNPLQKNNTILNPILRHMNNSEHTLIQDYIDEENKRLIPKLMMDTNSDLYITFSNCNQSLFDEFQCASQNDIDEFQNQQGNEIWILINFSVINPSTFKKHQFKKHFTISLDNKQCITQRLQFQASQYLLSSNFLYRDFKEDYGFGDVAAITYVNSLDYCAKSYQRSDTYAVIDITMDDKLTIQMFQYPVIGQVLAQIGSIVSVLFMIQFIIVEINRKFMLDDIIKQILVYYYPEVEQIKIQKSCFGQIKQVVINKKLINVQSYKEFMKSMRQKIEVKLSYTNLLYEISKMQQMILQFVNRDQILELHQQHIKLPFKEQDEQFHIMVTDSCRMDPSSRKIYPIDNTTQNTVYSQQLNSKFNEFDIDIFSLSHQPQLDKLEIKDIS